MMLKTILPILVVLVTTSMLWTSATANIHQTMLAHASKHPHMKYFVSSVNNSAFKTKRDAKRSSCCFPERCMVHLAGFDFMNTRTVTGSPKCAFSSHPPQFNTAYYDITNDRARFDGGEIVPEIGASTTVILGDQAKHTTYFAAFNDTVCVCWKVAYTPMQAPCMTGESSGVTHFGDGQKLGILTERYTGPSKGHGLATVYVRHLSHHTCVPVTSRYLFHIEEPRLTKDMGGTYTYEDFTTVYDDNVFTLPSTCPSLEECGE